MDSSTAGVMFSDPQPPHTPYGGGVSSVDAQPRSDVDAPLPPSFLIRKIRIILATGWIQPLPV